MSLNFLATRFQCPWPWTTVVMLCDGRIVCAGSRDACRVPDGAERIGWLAGAEDAT